MSISVVVILGYKPSVIDCANSVLDTYRESISKDKFCNRRSIYYYYYCCCCVKSEREGMVLRKKLMVNKCVKINSK